MATTYTLDDNGSTDAANSPEASGYKDPSIFMVATGDFGSGTLTVEFSVDGVAWGPSSYALTDDGTLRFPTHPKLFYRATLSGASAPDIDVTFLD